MKKYIIIAIALICGLDGLAESKVKKVKTDPVRFAVGVHTGIDIGAAVPWPPGEAIGGGNKMSATPRLTPALGLSYTTIFDKHWSVTLESTYKTVAMDAKTWVTGQIFNIKNDKGEVNRQMFRGSAEANMAFTMIEIPLYLKYTFKNDNSRIFLGPYYAYVIKGSFEAIPQKGNLFDPDVPMQDQTNPVIVNPGDVVQNFDEDLDNWDVGFIMGYERKIASRVSLSGRFSMGFKDVFRPDRKGLDYAMWHMRGTVAVSYMFLRK